MGRRLVERRLAQIGARLRTQREELRVIDEQLAHLADEAGDLEIRALVAETPGADLEFRRAHAHVEAMTRQREHVLRSIAELERSSDQLLDRLATG